MRDIPLDQVVPSLTDRQERVLAVLREHPNEAFDARCLGMLVYGLPTPWDGRNDTAEILYVLRQLERKGLVWRDALPFNRSMDLVIAALRGTDAQRNGRLTLRTVETEKQRPPVQRLNSWEESWASE